MGYTTDFQGQFKLDKPLAPEHAAYLTAFNKSRRMRRDAKIADGLADPIRIAAGLPIGDEGGYYVGAADNDYGQIKDESINVKRGDYNCEPAGQPGLWCQWVPNEDGTAIEWDTGEKFYDYVPWLKYLIEHFLKPWGYVLNGEVYWQGEESGDVGKIVVNDNDVRVLKGRIVFEEDDE